MIEVKVYGGDLIGAISDWKKEMRLDGTAKALKIRNQNPKKSDWRKVKAADAAHRKRKNIARQEARRTHAATKTHAQGPRSYINPYHNTVKI